MRQFRHLFSVFSHAHGQPFWTSLVLLLFALIFLAVGILRVVEFQGLGFTRKRLRFLAIFHVLGCLLFSATIADLALDMYQLFPLIKGALFSASILILFPLHIYVALRRRILLKGEQG